MKHFFSFLLGLIIFSISVNGQILPDNSTKLSVKNNTKSTKTIKQKLESKLIEQYDANNAQWTNSEKYEYEYYSDLNLKQKTLFTYNQSTSTFENSEKYEYTYDQNGNTTSKTTKYWNSSTEQWETNDMLQLTYTTDGKVESETYSFSDGTNMVNSQKYTYSYTDGKLTEKMSYNWDQDQWKQANKYIYSYTSDGSISTVINYYWNTSINDWKESGKHSYVYDANNNLIQEVYSTWDAGNDTWADYKKFDYEYDNDGNLTTKTESDWNYTDNKWDIKYQNTYSYNPSGGTASNAILRWDTDANALVYSSKTEFYYDASMQFDETIYPEPKDKEYIWPNKLTGKIEYSYVNDQFVEDKRYTMSYSEATYTPVAETAQASLKVYPNPSSDRIIFEPVNGPCNVEVFSAEGKQMISKQLKGNSLNIGNLPQGVYLYKLYTDDKVFTGRFIKK